MAGTVKKLQFSEGTDVGAPSDLSLATSTTVIEPYVDDAAFVTAEGAPGDGSVYVNTTLKTFRMYISGAWRNCVLQQDPADPTKAFLLDLTGNSTGVSVTLAYAATSNRTYTYPDVSMTVAGRANAETLSNKTLASPLISGGSVDVNAAGNLAIGASVGANNITVGGSSTTTVIPGNLQVQGTTTQVDTTNMNVKDANLLINDGGNDASAEGAGITVERTGTNSSLIQESALASKWKAGAAGAEEELVTTMHVQSIQKKRMRLDTVVAADDSTSPRLVLPRNTLANLQAITSGNHPAGGAVYWASDVGRAYIWDNTTNALEPIADVRRISVGREDYASGNDNSTDFEADLAGWSSYDDGAVTSPVDGTGGSPSAVTFSRNTSTPLNGAADLKIAKSAADGQGEGVALSFPIPRGYRFGQVSDINFLLNTMSANYATGDIKVYIYDVTNSTVIVPVDPELPANYNGPWQLSWTQPVSTASCRLLFHVATTNALAYDVFIDDVFVGPTIQNVVPGIIYTEGTQVEYAHNNAAWDSNDTTSFAFGAGGATISGALTASRTKRVELPHAMAAGKDLKLEFSPDGDSWDEAGSIYLGSDATQKFSDNGTNESGVGIEVVDSTHVDVHFGRYQFASADNSSLVNWSSGYWRLRQSANPVGVGFNLADEDLPGLVSNIDQDISGPKKFLDGVANFAVDSAPTSVILTKDDNRTQAFNAPSTLAVQMPKTGIRAFEIWTFYNSTINPVLFTADDASSIGFLQYGAGSVGMDPTLYGPGKVEMMALIADPATYSDWKVLSVDHYQTSEVINFPSSGAQGAQTFGVIVAPNALYEGIIVVSENGSNYAYSSFLVTAGQSGSTPVIAPVSSANVGGSSIGAVSYSGGIHVASVSTQFPGDNIELYLRRVAGR